MQRQVNKHLTRDLIQCEHLPKAILSNRQGHYTGLDRTAQDRTLAIRSLMMQKQFHIDDKAISFDLRGGREKSSDY